MISQKHKKILIATGLFPPEVGGPATYSKLLLEELPKHGFEVSVVPFRITRRFPKIIRHIAYFFVILRRGKNADIIFAQDPVSVGLPALCAARVLKKRFLLKVVGDYAWEQGVGRFGVTESLDVFSKKKSRHTLVRFLQRVERYVARHAEQVIVPSEYLKRIVGNWGVNEKKIVVVYNGFRVQTLETNKETLRGLLSFQGTLIMSAGRLVPWKGFETLIELTQRLAHRFPDIKLIIAGEGPEEAALKRSIQKLGLESRVVLMGVLSKDVLSRYLSAADIFVLNTFYEGFSHQLLEVMAVGTPIVTTNVGGNPELITNAKDGLVVDYNDKKALEKAIVSVLEDAELRKKLSENAKRKVTHFSEEKMLNELTHILKNYVE